jgi:hypothetical protein
MASLGRLQAVNVDASPRAACVAGEPMVLLERISRRSSFASRSVSCCRFHFTTRFPSPFDNRSSRLMIALHSTSVNQPFRLFFYYLLMSESRLNGSEVSNSVSHLFPYVANWNLEFWITFLFSSI